MGTDINQMRPDRTRMGEGGETAPERTECGPAQTFTSALLRSSCVCYAIGKILSDVLDSAEALYPPRGGQALNGVYGEASLYLLWMVIVSSHIGAIGMGEPLATQCHVRQ